MFLGAFKLIHLQPLEPILSSDFLQIINVIIVFGAFKLIHLQYLEQIFTCSECCCPTHLSFKSCFRCLHCKQFTYHILSLALSNLVSPFPLFTLFTVHLTHSSTIYLPVSNIVSPIALVYIVYSLLASFS